MRFVITRVVISLRILDSKTLQAELGLVTIAAMHPQNAMHETSQELCSARPRTGEPNATFGCTEATTPAWQCFHVHSINASVGPSPDEATTATWRYHRNQQYSITAVTTSSGSVAERYAYTAYGQPTILDGSGSVLSSSAINNRYTYTGREWDATLGLYHFRARWMSGLAGRFMGRDPIKYWDGPNMNSMKLCVDGVDPYGLAYTDPAGRSCDESKTCNLWLCAYCGKKPGWQEIWDNFQNPNTGHTALCFNCSRNYSTNDGQMPDEEPWNNNPIRLKIKTCFGLWRGGLKSEWENQDANCTHKSDTWKVCPETMIAIDDRIRPHFDFPGAPKNPPCEWALIPSPKKDLHNCSSWACMVVSEAGIPFPTNIIDPYYLCNGDDKHSPPFKPRIRRPDAPPPTRGPR